MVFYWARGHDVFGEAHDLIDYDVETLPSRDAAVALTCASVIQTYRSSFKELHKMTPSNYSSNNVLYDFLKNGKWGWKAPRSIYYLPLLLRVLKGNLRFIHVIRDGREISVADNQQQYVQFCKAKLSNLSDEFFTFIKRCISPDFCDFKGPCADTIIVKTVCAPKFFKFVNANASTKNYYSNVFSRISSCFLREPKNILAFWSNINQQVYTYGVSVLGPKRYFPLRIEDIALFDAEPTVRRLLTFLGITRSAKRIKLLVESCKGFEKTYGGGKEQADFWAQLLRNTGSTGAVALSLFGYNTSVMGTTFGTFP